MFMNGLTKEALRFLLPTAKISLSHLLSNQFPLSSITHSLPDIISLDVNVAASFILLFFFCKNIVSYSPHGPVTLC